jgi:hypothetical protein
LKLNQSFFKPDVCIIFASFKFFIFCTAKLLPQHKKGIVMIGRFQTAKTKKMILKRFLWTFFVCAAAVTWIGISTLLADENDPVDHMNNHAVDFQNAAQEQHAKNVAIKAALQDPEVIEAISDAKESGNFEEVRSLFKEKVADYTRQISDLRAEGWGWGEIARKFDVDPRYLGLGHFKNKAKYGAHSPRQHHVRSKVKTAKAATKPGGPEYKGYNKDQNIALGNAKAVGGGQGASQGRGNGGGQGKGIK